MEEFKQNHEAFVTEFKTELLAKRDEFLLLGIDVDNEDVGVPYYQMQRYIRDNPTDEVVSPFLRKHRAIMGDLSWSSPYIQSLNPFSFSVLYKGKTINRAAFGQDIYLNVYGTITGIAQDFANWLLLPAHVAEKYLEDDKEARNYLMSFLDFKNTRNWTIVWAKLDWIKLCFPKCYEKMIKDEFFTLEEVEEKMKETTV